jgi:hypothetical protein
VATVLRGDGLENLHLLRSCVNVLTTVYETVGDLEKQYGRCNDLVNGRPAFGSELNGPRNMGPVSARPVYHF